MPEENDPNSVIDAVRTHGARVVSVVPRRKRLEDLFVEAVTSKSGATI
jgi:ABC-2 type transport system ATP-binding protein